MNRGLKEYRYRLILVGGLFLMMFFAVGFRAFQLQIFRGEKLKRLGQKQHLQKWIRLPKRGSILGRSGESLASSLELESVFGRPRRIKNPHDAAAKLAPALSLTSPAVRRKLKTKKSFVWLKRRVTPRETKKVRNLDLNGVGLFYEPKRYYPKGQLAGQVIGFVGDGSQGLEGVERHYDSYINAEADSLVTERDALGHKVLIHGVERVNVAPGADVHLTLDTSIQHLAEKNLEAAVVKFRAKAGVAVVVEPFTGEILALANYPFFDPNNFSRQSSRRWRNRAIADLYEPGSTFKAILAAAALEEGVVGKEDLFYCELGKYSLGGKDIHDSKKHGWLPFYKIIQYSSNIGTTKVAEKLKKKRYFKYIKNFGFGSPTGIDLPGEAKGLVRLP
ncbi:MAG: penicillin-binding transpeptidase domain-containing protein, partial [Candidatus Binatia bacterium]|nr:penicillin-binding transpeptidase domain-containing protein [Candidatus Binatia bacterium]